jgi:hypothetical protein
VRIGFDYIHIPSNILKQCKAWGIESYRLLGELRRHGLKKRGFGV